MQTQSAFRLRVPREPGESSRNHAWRQAELNHQPDTARQQDRFAALLKRQGDEVMRAVTECAPAALPQAIARLHDLADVIRFAVSNGLVDRDEADLSGPNLLHLHSLADYQAALEITRQTQRAPVFASRWATELGEIAAKLDAIIDRQESLAGLVALRNDVEPNYPLTTCPECNEPVPLNGCHFCRSALATSDGKGVAQ